MKIKFRKALCADAVAVINIARYTVDTDYKKWLDPDLIDNYLSSKKFDDYLIKNLKHTWVVTIGTEIVGFAVCIENMIDYILVHADHQNRGIATSLLNFCEETVFSQYNTIALENYAANMELEQFLSKLGWEYSNKYTDPCFDLLKHIYIKKIEIENLQAYR